MKLTVPLGQADQPLVAPAGEAKGFIHLGCICPHRSGSLSRSSKMMLSARSRCTLCRGGTRHSHSPRVFTTASRGKFPGGIFDCRYPHYVLPSAYVWPFLPPDASKEVLWPLLTPAGSAVPLGTGCRITRRTRHASPGKGVTFSSIYPPLYSRQPSVARTSLGLASSSNCG